MKWNKKEEEEVSWMSGTDVDWSFHLSWLMRSAEVTQTHHAWRSRLHRDSRSPASGALMLASDPIAVPHMDTVPCCHNVHFSYIPSHHSQQLMGVGREKEREYGRCLRRAMPYMGVELGVDSHTRLKRLRWVGWHGMGWHGSWTLSVTHLYPIYIHQTKDKEEIKTMEINRCSSFPSTIISVLQLLDVLSESSNANCQLTDLVSELKKKMIDQKRWNRYPHLWPRQKKKNVYLQRGLPNHR